MKRFWGEPAVAATLSIAAGVAFVWHGRWIGWAVVDDAGIFLVYARTFFEGHGFRVTPGSQVVEGFSSPLWTLLVGLFLPLKADPEGFAQWLALSSGGLGVAALGWWGAAGEGRPLQWEDAVPAWLAAASPTIAAWTGAGMETGLYVLCLSGAGLASLRAARIGKGWLWGVCLGLLALARPEAALASAWCGVVVVVSRVWNRQPVLRLLAQGLVPAMGLLGGWLIFRRLYFGDWLPNTYWAKLFYDFGAGAYLGGFLQTYQTLLMAAGLGLVIALFHGPNRARGLLAAGFAVAVGYFAWSARGDWMGEWRFLAPAVPFIGVCVGAGLSSVRERAVHPRRWVGALAWCGGLTIAWLSLGATSQALVRRGPIKASPQFSFGFVRGQFREVKKTLDALGQRRPLIAFPDLGGQAWELRDAEIIDDAGLGDRAIALHAANHPAQEDYLAMEGPPAMLDAHGPSGFVVNYRKVMDQMQQASWAYWTLKGLSATEDPRCPGGKAAVLALDPGELLAAMRAKVSDGDAVIALKLWRCAFAYQPDDKLPSWVARALLAREVEDKAHALEEAGNFEPALRHASLATVLAGQPGGMRRWTERLRARVFVPPAPAH